MTNHPGYCGSKKVERTPPASPCSVYTRCDPVCAFLSVLLGRGLSCPDAADLQRVQLIPTALENALIRTEINNGD